MQIKEIEQQLICCRDSKFQCDDGECVPRSQVCDRQPDCAEGEDELNCRKLLLLHSFTF